LLLPEREPAVRWCQSDAGAPRRNSIELELLLGGDLSEEQRQRLAEIDSRCPIPCTLTEGVTITHR
jgi:uncharacterized OsmC-like protein